MQSAYVSPHFTYAAGGESRSSQTKRDSLGHTGLIGFGTHGLGFENWAACIM